MGMNDLPNQAPTPSGLAWRNSDADLVFDAVWIARNYKVVLDTDSLTNPYAQEVLVGQLLPALVQEGVEALVSERTVTALQVGEEASHRATAEVAKRGNDVLRAFKSKQALGTAEDPHIVSGDPLSTELLLPDLFVGYQQGMPLCLITQSSSLAWEVLRNSRSEAFKHAKSVVAAYVAHDGIRNWAPELANQPVMPPLDIGRDEPDLESSMPDCKVFVDTCAWMMEDMNNLGTNRGAPFLLHEVFPLLEHSSQFFIPKRVRLELEKHAESQDVRGALARTGLDAIKKFEDAGLATEASDPNEVAGSERFADPLLVRLAIRFQSDFDLCFITQDEKLARLLLACRKMGTGRKFLVKFIPMRFGKLTAWALKLNRPANSKQQPSRPEAKPQGRQESEFPAAPRQNGPLTLRPDAASPRQPQVVSPKQVDRAPTPLSPQPPAKPARRSFDILTELRRPDPTPLTVATLPVAGSTVIGVDTGALMLVKQIGAGGEGVVYTTNREGIVCKIYHPECLTVGRREKLALMCSRKVRIEGVCWPEEIVTTADDEFAGYLMHKVAGRPLKTTVFAKLLLEKHFPKWTRVELTELAITLLTTIRELHYIGVLVGDINPLNILVTDEKHIAIVDGDSFQVEGYACPVGFPTFTPPGRQGLLSADSLRTHEDELYAVATLLFHVLFPGKTPYAAQGGGDIDENIKNMRFAYGRDADGRPPVGPWQFIWSHLHPKLKDDFTDVFARGNRVGIDKLVQDLEVSLKEMRAGTRDASIFPKGPWLRDPVTAHCETCPPEVAMQQINRSHAEKLKAEGNTFKCQTCFDLKKIKQVTNTRLALCKLTTSPQCEGESQVAVAHLDELKRMNRDYWCGACRTHNRLMREARNTTRTSRGQASDNSGSKTPCFVATAVYQDPMAAPVVSLRRFRDDVLAHRAPGRAFIAAYYVVGPWLARGVTLTPWLRPSLKRALDGLVNILARRYPSVKP